MHIKVIKNYITKLKLLYIRGVYTKKLAKDAKDSLRPVKSRLRRVSLSFAKLRKMRKIELKKEVKFMIDKRLRMQFINEKGKNLFAMCIADYILLHHATIRQTAERFKCDKTVINYNIENKVKLLDPQKYKEIKIIFEENLKHGRGGNVKHKDAICNNYPKREEFIQKLNSMTPEEVCQYYFISKSMLRTWKEKLEIQTKSKTTYYYY